MATATSALREITVRLESPVATSFRCRRAADSLDIDAAKKSVHEITVALDVATPYGVGLIVGASGSGKTTLARALFGDDAMRAVLDPARPVIDQFPAAWSYDECAAALAGVGLTSVPCWIRPAHTLSNGQRARAEAALQFAAAGPDHPVVIDEWTSVVDRTVAKVMSHCVQKHARRTEGTRIVLVSCHYDVVDWLNPDWVVDCNRATYDDRRSLWRGYTRPEQLRFDVRRLDRAEAKRVWPFFSRYHYLSATLAKGEQQAYGLFHGADQVGFQAFNNYVPDRPGTTRRLMHSNRTVIHPDYAGLGLGIKLITATSADMDARGYRVMAKFSSLPIYRLMRHDPAWRFTGIQRQIGHVRSGGGMDRKSGFRENVKTYHFEYVGGPVLPAWADRRRPGSSGLATAPAGAEAVDLADDAAEAS